MRLYDTRSRHVEDIVPSTRGHLKVYCCGPTVYRYAHVGNLRTFLLGDLVARTAEVVHGWRTTVVQNITDVGHMQGDVDPGELAPDGADSAEDKLLAAARAEQRSAIDIARHYEEAFHRDLSALNVRPADAYPRASDSIDLMLELIGTLVERGHAYVGTDGSVFFDAQSFDTYGEISGNRLDHLKPGHRFAGGVDESKRFHADWALWKSAGERTELVWESPWGTGFPGWHVECSAMSLEHLGDPIDVHTGGIDLRFPHHEDERAQTNAAVGHDVVRHWVHAEHLLFEGRKMAKSTGNVVLLSDVIERGLDPLAVRLAFLGMRYRTQADLTWASLDAAEHQLARWRGLVAQWAEAPSKPMAAAYVEQLHSAFAEDLDSPRALQVMRAIERDAEIPDGEKFELYAHADRLLGVDLARDVGRAKPVATLPDGAQTLLDRRADARTNKDFATSDALRDELAVLGVTVTDTKDGQSWTTA